MSLFARLIPCSVYFGCKTWYLNLAALLLIPGVMVQGRWDGNTDSLSLALPQRQLSPLLLRSCGFGRTLQAGDERTVKSCLLYSHVPKYPLWLNQRGVLRGDIVHPTKNEQGFRLLLCWSSHDVLVFQIHTFLKSISVAKTLTQTKICPNWTVKRSMRWGMKEEEGMISPPATSSQEWAGPGSALPKRELWDPVQEPQTPHVGERKLHLHPPAALPTRPSPSEPPGILPLWWGFGSCCDNPTVHTQVPKSWLWITPCALALPLQGRLHVLTDPAWSSSQPGPSAKPELLRSDSFASLRHWEPCFQSWPALHCSASCAQGRARLSARALCAIQPARANKCLPSQKSRHK